MNVKAPRLAAVLLLGFCAALSSAAQSPAGGELLLNPSYLPESQYASDVACDRSGTCLVTWDFGVFSPSGEYLGSKFAATTVAPTGAFRSEKILAEDEFAQVAQVVASGRRFAYFWSEFHDVNRPFYQWLDAVLEPRSSVVELPVPAEESGTVIDVQPIPGGFVQLEVAYDKPIGGSDGAFLGFVDFNGRRLRPTFNVNESPDDDQRSWRGGLAVDVPAGIITVAYEQVKKEELASSDVYFRRFSLAGEPLTPTVRANTYLPDWQTYPSVAPQPGGAFVMVWTSDGQDGSHNGIFGRRFTNNGVAAGPEFPVNQVTFSDQRVPLVATDAAGNFVVAWSSYDPDQFGVRDWDVKGRLYRPDGTPVGPEIYINRYRISFQDIPNLAFSPNGTFFVAWTGTSQIGPQYTNLLDVYGRRFSASPADEPCIVGGGTFLCDTGRTGGDPEVKHPFGGSSSGYGFLGDVDGDGREDPCVYTGAGVFRCDTDHEGGAAEVQITFSMPGGAVPLLGDMDGDGRADPCLAVAGRFACDTRHDGGSAELTISFGAAGETLLLGDVDGDGRAEACGYTPGQLRCDTGHNGGSAETVIRFGKRGDSVLLGDFDGDGRDDPCVFRKGMLLCDTAHDGGAAEASLAFGKAGDRLILGNLDGL